LPIIDPRPETISVPARTAAALSGKSAIKMASIEPQAAASEMPPNNLEKIRNKCLQLKYGYMIRSHQLPKYQGRKLREIAIKPFFN